MAKTDQVVIAIILLLVILFLAVWAAGYYTHKLSYFIAILNAFAATLVVGYWLIRQLQKQVHFFEFREIIVLGIEIMIVVAAVYAISSGNKYKWVTTIQYIVFAIHLLLLLLGLIFMVTVKFNKLM
jgi:hypothetical protein